MLHEGHELDVGVTHFLYIGDELLRQVVIGVVGAALRGEGVARTGVGAVLTRFALRLIAVAMPGAQMDFVDVEGACHEVALIAFPNPRCVLPGIAREVPKFRGSTGWGLSIESKGIGFPEKRAVRGFDYILVKLSRFKPGNEALPDVALIGAGKRGCPRVPVAEIACHVDAGDVGSPYAEQPTFTLVLNIAMCAHLLPGTLPCACREHVDIVIGEYEVGTEICRARSSLGLRFR